VAGWEARKLPVAVKVFFLDFPFYRTYQDVAMLNHLTRPRGGKK
jgi:hypothetical protein